MPAMAAEFGRWCWGALLGSKQELCCCCRYFAESAATLACMVFGVRNGVSAEGTPTRDYWITDGARSVIVSISWRSFTEASQELIAL